MIQPTRRAVLLFALGIPVALLPALADPATVRIWAALAAASALALLADLLLAVRPRRIAVEWRAPDTLGIGGTGELALAIAGGARAGGLAVEVVLDLDPELEPVPPRALVLGEEGCGTLVLPLVPRRRGTLRVDAVRLRWPGPLGLVRRRRRFEVDHRVAVVPGLRRVRAAAIRFARSHELAAGGGPLRRVGDGSEFESLREYVFGLDPRAMDWKASARHLKPLVRCYRAERNRQIVIAFDTGRLMREPLAGIPRLDHAIDAGLLLAWVALRTGDRVGLFAFDAAVRLAVEPRGGLGALEGLLRASAGVFDSTEETNFTLGLSDLSRRLRRRSLVVLFTELVDTVTAELMVENLGRLAARHVVLFVTFDDAYVRRLLAEPPREPLDVHRAVVAGELRREREQVLARLRNLGVHVLDAAPEQVSSATVDRYLRIHQRELV